MFLFRGHTHGDLALPDWYARRVVPGTANPDGFSVINTAAISTGYKDDGMGGEVPVSGTFNQGLQVEVRRNQVLIQARDFGRRTWMKQIAVPLHTPLQPASTNPDPFTSGAKTWPRGPSVADIAEIRVKRAMGRS